MTAIMSTKAGVHGDSPATAVPRKTLVAALDTRMTLLSTQYLTSGQPFYELAADLATTNGFVKVSGPWNQATVHDVSPAHPSRGPSNYPNGMDLGISGCGRCRLRPRDHPVGRDW